MTYQNERTARLARWIALAVGLGLGVLAVVLAAMKGAS
jgi:hypothetical protein